jgi:hypothetical protein
MLPGARVQLENIKSKVASLSITYSLRRTMSNNINRIIVERLFSEIGERPGKQIKPPSPLTDFLDAPALVVLGDPGAGKTTAFLQSVSREPNAEFVTVREFLVLQTRRYRGKTLYLDALDEMRGRTADGRSTVDQIVHKLDELGCPPFRISCRAADWYGSSDSAILNRVSPNKEVRVLTLEPLQEQDIEYIASGLGLDFDLFSREARNRGIVELLENPQTLLMIADVVKAGAWPETKTELFEKACTLLCTEVNEEHRRKSSAGFRTEELLSAAGKLCSVVLCSGAQGVIFDEGRSNNEFIFIDTIGNNIQALKEAARRRLFKAIGSETVIPIHRTIAEYLAARYLYNRVSKGLPLGRILALITGYDGGTLSDLRGLFAWLACLCRIHSETLVRTDPLGIILYGDPSLLSTSSKRHLFNMLAELANENPWFRSEGWTAHPFGALGTPDMESVFREMLMARTYHPVAISCVLDAISYGQPIPALTPVLLAIVRDESREEFLREDALKAYINNSLDQNSGLTQLLEDVHSGHISDSRCQLRALLLSYLYPKTIGPADVIKYIVEDPSHFVGKYVIWVTTGLLGQTKREDIPILLDAALLHDRQGDRSRWHSWRSFIGKLLQEGVAIYGENVSADRLYHWLGLALDKYGGQYIEKEDSEAIYKWLTSHPQKVRDLYHYWLSETQVDDLMRESYRFKERLFRIDAPKGFGQWLLDLAAGQEDDRVAFFLFREGVQLRTIHNREDAPTIEDLYRFVRHNPRFHDILQSETYVKIDEWRWNQAWRSIKTRQKQEIDRSDRVRWLVNNLEQVRSGKHVGALNLLAGAYFGLYRDINEDLSPFDRIVSITNNECAEAAFEGFVACLKNEDMPQSTAISDLHSRGRIYNVGYAVLAGMDILANCSMKELQSLPKKTLRSALAFHFAMGFDEEPNWINALFASDLSTVSEVLEELWRLHLSQRCEHIEALSLLLRDPRMSAFAGEVSIGLLRDFPNCRPHHLRYMLLAAIKHGDKAALHTVCRQVLSRPAKVRGTQRVLWYATAFALNPEEFTYNMKRYIGRDQVKAEELLALLRPSWREERELITIYLPLAALAHLISICGPIFRNTSDMDDSVMAVRGLINHITANTDQEATNILKSLRSHRGLSSWRDLLAHAEYEQLKRRREEKFRYPSVMQVISTLNGGSPANPSDLQAMIYDHLLTLRDDIGHGPTDGYKAFWNVDHRGRPDNPRPEDDCRDRLLDLLRERLASLGLAAEPEGHYARDKRSDVKVLFGGMNLPIEIKRHYHRDLWTAPTRQLRDLYSRDPGAGGRGIYLVFWFGIAPGRKVPRPPNGIESPSNASDLEKALLSTLPKETRDLIKVIAIDCSISYRNR